jgi:hypothetical protein
MHFDLLCTRKVKSSNKDWGAARPRIFAIFGFTEVKE